MNFDLNVGGLIGAIACGGIAGVMLFSGAVFANNPGRLFTLSIIVGAILGNIAWGMIFRKPGERGKALVKELTGRAAPGGGHERSTIHSDSKWAILASAIILVVTLIVEHLAVGSFLKAREAEHWPTVKGTITRSEMQQQPGDKPSAMIQYVYVIAEKQYQSNNLRTRGNTEKTRSAVTAIVEKYPVGGEVPVYYNPADPADAYLEAGVDVSYYISIIAPLIFATAAGTHLFTTLRGKSKG